MGRKKFWRRECILRRLLARQPQETWGTGCPLLATSSLAMSTGNPEYLMSQQYNPYVY
jgi:hypothetical protein